MYPLISCLWSRCTSRPRTALIHVALPFLDCFCDFRFPLISVTFNQHLAPWRCIRQVTHEHVKISDRFHCCRSSHNLGFPWWRLLPSVFLQHQLVLRCLVGHLCGGVLGGNENRDQTLSSRELNLGWSSVISQIITTCPSQRIERQITQSLFPPPDISETKMSDVASSMPNSEE